MSVASSEKIGVAILGATGTVGQKFIQLLEDHPFFEVRAVAASEKSSGKPYCEAVQWKQTTPIPDHINQLPVISCTPSLFSPLKLRVIFSALDSSVAGTIEAEFAAEGFAVFSNSRNHRMDALVPICLPTVNPDHLEEAVKWQQLSAANKKGGFIVTNANCSTTGLVTVLRPLMEYPGVEKCFVTTMQAVSGGGYPGVPSLDVLDNVVPFISGEEEKMEVETRKMLGKAVDGAKGFEYDPIVVSAHCNRVAVIDGHTECVSIQFKQKTTIEEVATLLENYRPAVLSHLPSAPAKVIQVMKQQDRPQPRLDRDRGNGFTVTVGRIRNCNLFDIKLTLLLHNTVIGAAGSSILNAELAKAKNLL